jgi:lysozyme
VLTLATVLAIELWLPGRRPPLRAGERYGVDVSAHQGSIDWPAVAADGVSAAYLKATEGATFRDPSFVANWQQARAAGLQVGAYHFFTLCRSGTDQAANLLSALDQVGGRRDARSLPVVVDLELSGNCSARPPKATVQRQLDAFVDAVEQGTGRPVRYYVLNSWDARYPPTRDRDRWVRSLVVRPTGSWVWWQASNRARVAGVRGPVDLNVITAAR